MPLCFNIVNTPFWRCKHDQEFYLQEKIQLGVQIKKFGRQEDLTDAESSHLPKYIETAKSFYMKINRNNKPSIIIQLGTQPHKLLTLA